MRIRLFMCLFWVGVRPSWSYGQLSLPQQTSDAAEAWNPQHLSFYPEGEGKIVVFGFRPFGGMKDNISMRLAQKLDGRKLGRLHYRFVGYVLPVCYASAADIVRQVLMLEKPKAVVIFGIVGQAGGLSLESMARNLKNETDECGERPTNEPIAGRGIASYATRIPLDRLSRGLDRQKIPHKVSIDAGAGVCNSTYYQALQTVAVHGLRSQVLLVHMNGGWIDAEGHEITDEQCLRRRWQDCPSTLLAQSQKLLAILAEMLEPR